MKYLKGFLIALILITTLAIGPHLTASAQIGNDQPQVPSTVQPTTRFVNLTTEDGLIHNEVTAILQDRHGFMWFGTGEGLNRYDGYRFEVFKHDPGNPNSLSSNIITDLLEDREGIIWIATDGGGVSRYDPGKDSFSNISGSTRNQSGLSSPNCDSLAKDSQGNIWIGTNNGLNKYNLATDTITQFLVRSDGQPELNFGPIRAIEVDQLGNIWLAAHGLIKFTPGSSEFIRYLPENTSQTRSNSSTQFDSTVVDILIDSQGKIWASMTNGFYQFDPEGEFFTKKINGAVTATMQNQDGTLWVAEVSAVHIFNAQENQIIETIAYDPANPEGLNSSLYNTLIQDAGGLVWMGSTDAGINIYSSQQSRFSNYRSELNNTQNSLAAKSVERVYVDESGVVWVGTRLILNRLDRQNGEISHYSLSSGAQRPPGPQHVVGIYDDAQGHLWVAMRDGLFRLDKESGQSETFPAPASGDRPPIFTDMAVDKAGNDIWFVTHNELLHFDLQAEQYTDNRITIKISPQQIDEQVIIIDQQGDIWVGMVRGMLLKIDPQSGQQIEYQHQPLDTTSVGRGRINAITEDKSGNLWIAASEGLNHFDRQSESFSHYTERDGLPSSNVQGVLQDEAGNLWVSTSRGIAKVDSSVQPIAVTNYDTRDGLGSYSFNPDAQFATPDGELFFGGENGLTSFYPNEIVDSTYPPPIVFTEFQYANKSVGISQPVGSSDTMLLTAPIWETEQIVLDWDHENLYFEFAALDYANPRENQYQYKLEALGGEWTGFDLISEDFYGEEDGWHQLDSDHRFAAFSLLPPGDFALRVRGSNHDGIWSDQEAALHITVIPPYWETLWFRVLVGIGAVGLLFGAYRWRVSSMRRRTRQLEAEVDARTQDLAASNSQLLVAKEKALEAQRAAEVANQAKSVFLANMSHELRTPLNAILGFSQILARSPNLPTEHRDDINIINRSGEHLLTLINQVLALTKIEAGRTTLDESNFDLYRMLDDIQNMFTFKVSKKLLELNFECEDDVPQFICADETKLRQVLINLLGNALKFTESGVVSLLVSTEVPSRITFDVADTGQGISSEEMDDLFEAFVQTEAGRQSKEGTGLGLPISRKFVRMMGGDMTVSSQEGIGTTFSFNIHVQVMQATDIDSLRVTRRAIALEPGQPRYKMLIVDDKADNRKLLVSLLNPFGFKLRQAENGQEAVDIWDEWQPDIVWMDMRMPVMDGYEATKYIKSTDKGQHTPVIAVSASSFEEGRVVVMQSGCDDFMRKPFKEEELFELARKHLGIQFIYDEPEVSAESKTVSVLTPGALAVLQLDLRTRLANAIDLGDMEIIIQILEEVRNQEEDVAASLRRMVDNFEYDAIITLLEGSTSNTEEESHE